MRLPHAPSGSVFVPLHEPQEPPQGWVMDGGSLWVTSALPCAHTPGVAFSNGERTKQLKRFCLHVLRELGVGKRGTEHRIQQEADFLIEALRSTRGEQGTPECSVSRRESPMLMTWVVAWDRDTVVERLLCPSSGV